jgi:hypothetical protein
MLILAKEHVLTIGDGQPIAFAALKLTIGSNFDTTLRDRLWRFCRRYSTLGGVYVECCTCAVFAAAALVLDAQLDVSKMSSFRQGTNFDRNESAVNRCESLVAYCLGRSQ